MNRAISLYEFIDALKKTDGDLLIRDNSTGEVQHLQAM
jgi:hypothetical protein